MAKQLKVYRTAAGFHDAYVAAPSKAAALRAWGAERDLFALGAAEEVTDAKLTKAPLAKPGEVLKVARVDDEGDGEARQNTTKTPPKAAKPRPKRTALDHAEAKLAAIEADFDSKRAAIDAKEAALAAERRKLVTAERAARDKAQAAIDTARDTYDRALDAWRQSAG